MIGTVSDRARTSVVIQRLLGECRAAARALRADDSAETAIALRRVGAPEVNYGSAKKFPAS